MSASIGLDWALVGDYGNLAILTADNISKDSSIYTKAKSAVISQADTFVNCSSNSPYGVADVYKRQLLSLSSMHLKMRHGYLTAERNFTERY